MYNFQFQEFPFVRYRAPKGGDATDRDLIPMKLAGAVWNNITAYRTSIANFPSAETCELLIVDRSVDQVSKILSNNLMTLILFSFLVP